MILLDDMAANINGWSVAAQQRVKDNLSELSVYDYRLLSTSLMLLSVEVGLGQTATGWVFVEVDCGVSRFGSQILDSAIPIPKPFGLMQSPQILLGGLLRDVGVGVVVATRCRGVSYLKEVVGIGRTLGVERFSVCFGFV